MANKLAALLVIFLVIAAAVQLPTARAEDDDSNNNNNEETHSNASDDAKGDEDTKTQGVYLPCLKECIKDCEAKQGRTLCEMKCDTDCFNKAIQGKIKTVTL